MNAIASMMTGNLVQAIGWALLHLVWQGLLVATILAAALALLQQQSANARYLASCGALLLLVALGVATTVRAYEPSAGAGVLAGPERPRTAAPTLIVESVDSPPVDLAFISFATTHLPEIVALWLAGVLILSARLVLGWIGAHRLATRRAHQADMLWEQSLQQIAEALDLRRRIRVLESAAVEVPTVIGWLRPVVLLPVATLSGLSIQQIEMILAHELAHIRRHDFIVNLLQSVVETLLFYHPAVWWISRRIRVEREHCCDDLAVAVCGDPVQYAKALTRFEELRIDAQSVLAASGGSLLSRIRRLVVARAESSNWPSRWAAGAALLAVLAVVLVAPALPLFANHEEPTPPRPPAPAIAPQPAPTPPIPPAPPAPPAAKKHTADCDKTLTELQSAIDVEASSVEAEAPSVKVIAPRLAKIISTMDLQPMIAPAVRQSLAVALGNIDIGSIEIEGKMKRRHKIGESGKLTVDDLITLSTVGVTPKYVEEMRAAGLGELSLDDIASLCMQRVSASYAKEMAAAGYAHLKVRELIELRMQGVTPAFVKSLADAGYTNLPVKDLVRLRMSGVNADFIRELSKYRTK